MLRCVVVFIFATVCFALTEDSVSIIVEDSTRLIDGESFPSYYFRGNGINWKDVGGIMGLVIPENQPFNVVYTNNLTSEETIIHAHGLTPPSPLDGVPYISSVPIFPGRSVHYEYNLDPIANQGTYYIHSHYGFQLGNGALAPLIIQGTVNGYPLNSLINQSIDLVMMLEDLCPHATGEYLEKRAFAEEQGFAIPREDIDRDRPEGAGDCSSWKTFLELAYDFTTTWYTPDGFSCSALEAATDSDVAYQKYLANGFTYRSPAIVSNIDFSVPIRYRVINGGGMTNFQLKFPFTVTLISMDGQWVNPYQNDTFWISVAQRLDFLIQVPQSYNSSYFTVTAWTENYKSSIPTPLIVSNLNTVPEKEHETIQSSVREHVESLQYATGMMDNHLDLLVTAFTPLEQRAPDLVEKVLLTGDNGFRGINHHSYRLPPTAPLPYVPNPNPIIVRYGQRVQFQIQNQNADGHPMHLHGHSFQITNIDGTDLPQGPMRDVAFVPGGCHNVTIEFEALNPGLWVFHCHLEFHQTAGMLTTVEYFI